MERMQLEGDGVLLEPLQNHHIGAYLEKFSPYVQNILDVKTIDSERYYLEQKLTQDSNTLFFYIIKERCSNRLIGAIEVRNPGHRSQLYVWLHEQWWGSGYFKEAFLLVADTYFKTTKMHTLSACVDYENKRSYHALKKVGFISEGLVGDQYVLTLSRTTFNVTK